jgi:peptidoglycan-associated lipoprotein
MRPAARVIAPILALLALGCARHGEPPRAVAVAAPAPLPPSPPAAPDTAPGPETATPDAAAPAPGPEPETFSARGELPDVHFASGQVRVERGGLKTLDAVVAWLKENPTQLVMIEGHTDAAGPRAANLALGQRRARWVMDYLVAKGVPAARITVVARGERDTLCADRSTACQRRNRRVHFLVRDNGPLPQLSASPSR